jgi:uncharacterized zinc-type alcohol dehydrogenase-like protein
MTEIHGWATHGPRQKLEPFNYAPVPLGPDDVEVAVEHCGFCYSDVPSSPRKNRRKNRDKKADG